jgi:hypothetical protein
MSLVFGTMTRETNNSNTKQSAGCVGHHTMSQQGMYEQVFKKCLQLRGSNTIKNTRGFMYTKSM